MDRGRQGGNRSALVNQTGVPTSTPQRRRRRRPPSPGGNQDARRTRRRVFLERVRKSKHGIGLGAKPSRIRNDFNLSSILCVNDYSKLFASISSFAFMGH
jgi:hypothetical protein